MSALSDITSTTDELGRATVRLGDRAGPILAATDTTGSVTYQRGADGGVSFHVALQGQISDFVPGGGAMAGMLDGAERINATRGAFNQVAKSFVETVNGLQAAGQDLNGNTGPAMFGLTAGTAQMSLLLTDGSTIAAARGNQGSRNSDNLDALETARGSNGFELKLTQIITDNATTLKQRQTVADAQTAISDGARATLSAASGITLDSEAVTLMRFQQAYSATSRVIQAARETFQSILELR
jgi:flagellar hook-associated protein 1 FlgK